MAEPCYQEELAGGIGAPFVVWSKQTSEGPPYLRRLLRRMGGRPGLTGFWRVVMVLILHCRPRWLLSWSRCRSRTRLVARAV